MMPGGRGSRCAVLVALAGCLLTTAGCAGGEAGAAASCADEIAIAGTHYIGGRDDGVPRPAPVSSELRGATVPCGDGNPPVVAVVAHPIPGVEVADAVLGPSGEVMLAQHWWGRPWSTLPSALQPYVHR
jgi:hypothetical protein